MRIVVEIGNEKDGSLLISLIKRLKGQIIEERRYLFGHKTRVTANPVSSLENIAKRGGIASIPDPSDWQRNQRKDRKIDGRD